MAISRASADRPAGFPAADAEWGSFCDDVLAFHGIWQGKLLGRALPARADFDPAEMKAHLPGITLIDVVPDARRFVYRLVGTREVAMRDNDPTGKGVAEGFFGTTAEQSLAAYQAVVDKRAPCFERRRFVTADGRVGNEESVLLPLSSDGVTIDMIIAYSHHFLARD
ncbi:PAS domain-containing protein [Dongia mobilis]|uniref:PAS domain-containing protein n=1 Tax=Dongia mobilis TaxID=578943 RepID=A0A4R6WQ60_9PROT|nr:PAS domain-containing protein [Dongia mobilis]TDQ83401.1 PAS domain-containing protein [Dongia mobilis]